MGRLLLNYELLKRGLPLLIIEREDRDEYLYLMDTVDLEGLAKYALDKIEKESKRRDVFLEIGNK